MKISFLLLLFVIITISICVLTSRKHITMEKFEGDNNAECEYDDKIIRTQDPTSGSTLVDCQNNNKVCQASFEANDPCIKNNFIDKRCKLIKIWFAKQVKDSYYTFSDDDKHTHIIQMNRDNNFNCRQFGDNDAQLISYLNSLPKSRIKNNTMSFTTEEEISSYTDGNPNDIDKLIVGYAYGADDEKTQSKQFDDMKVCINFESKFNNADGIFNKELLKNKTAEKTFFNPVVDTGAKIVNTGIKTLKRYIKKLSNGKYTIVYADSDTSKISDSNEVSVDNTNTIDLNAEEPKPCSSIVEKPDLWILHRSDEKYHRVEFTDELTKDTNSCKTIKDPNNSKLEIDTNNNSDIKTKQELRNNNYIEMDETEDVFKLNFDFNDTAKWFERKEDVYGNVHLTSHNVKSCGVNEYESSAPQTKDTLDLNRNEITMNVSDRTCAPLKQCSAWNIVTPPHSKKVQIYENDDSNEKKEVDMNYTNRECRPINIGGKSPNTYFIANYSDALKEGETNIFEKEFEFKQLTNCKNTTPLKEYVANQAEFNNSKKRIGSRGPTFHTINRDCQELTACSSNDYVNNADHFMFNIPNYNYNNVHSNLDCQPLTKCGETSFVQNLPIDKKTIRINGQDIELNLENYKCAAFSNCEEDEYVSNMGDLINTSNLGMYTKNVTCTKVSNCDVGKTYQKTAPINDNTLQMFVSDRVCAPVDPCNKPLQVEIPLSSELITQLSSMRFPSPATTQICSFNNDYFTGNDDNLNYFNCSRIKLAYKIIGSPTPTNDILKHSPKLILRKRRKEIIMMMKLNSSSTELTTYDTDTGVGIFSAFKKYPNDVFDLFFDTGSHLHISINISEFKFYCSRIQEIDVSSYKSDDGVVHNNVCRYEHKDIVTCNALTQYYDIDSNGNYVCKDYEPNDCKISDQKKSCAINNEDYTNENINTSYKRLYNDTLSSDTATQCATKCSERSGCGAFLINPLSNMCEYYGFETVKIEIGNIDISKFNIKYNTDDTSESEVFISKDDKYTVFDNGILTKKFTAPVHIVQVTIEPKNSTTRINDLPDDVYIKFYYYDNSFKMYTKSPNSAHSNEVDIDSYIRTDTLLEIQDIYYIPDDQ